MNKPNWTPIRIKLGDIIGWEHNPRMSNKAQAQRLIESEKRWGQPMAFAVSPFKDGKVFLYDGHQRYSSWLTVYGEDYEVDARQSDIFLTEDERLEFVVTMHAGATGSWDWQKLSSFPAPKLIEMGFDEGLKKQYDFDANNIKELLNSEKPEPVDAEPQIDRAAELQEKWQTTSGQLWKLGDHRLLIGDCTVRENVERLMRGERAGIMVTDPPYGVEYDALWRNETGSDADGKTVRLSSGAAVSKHTAFGVGKVENDDRADWSDAWKLFSGDVAYIWHAMRTAQIVGNSLLSSGFEIRDEIVWVKSQLVISRGHYHPKHESCFYAVKSGCSSNWIGGHKETTVWEIDKQAKSETGHSTQKPLECMERPIRNHSGDVYEPFAGSGTTIIAAHNLNRRCYAMEISEKYGAVILERFFTATGIQPELVTE